MKHFPSLRLMQIAFLLAGSSVGFSLAHAQTTQSQAAIENQWEKLHQANSHITASHVVWKRVQRITPISQASANAWAKGALAAVRKSAREQNLSEKQIQERAQMERRHALSRTKQLVINSTLDFVRVGNTILCHIEHPDPDYRSQSIEFSNGIDSLHAQMEVNGEDSIKSGTLMRDPTEVLSHSAGGFQVARFLLGLPLDKDFAPTNPALSMKNSSLKVLPDGNVIVEREARMENKRSQNPDAITFAKEGLYPISAESFSIAITIHKDRTMTMQKHKLQSHIVASDYKQYPGGIWFPSKIVNTSPTMTTEYTLVSAKFNDQVNRADLLLPPDLRVADARFGLGRNIVIYQTEDGKLLSDEEVKAQIVGGSWPT